MLILDVNVGQILFSEGSTAAGALVGGTILSVSCNLNDQRTDLGLFNHKILKCNFKNLILIKTPLKFIKLELNMN